MLGVLANGGSGAAVCDSDDEIDDALGQQGLSKEEEECNDALEIPQHYSRQQQQQRKESRAMMTTRSPFRPRMMIRPQTSATTKITMRRRRSPMSTITCRFNTSSSAGGKIVAVALGSMLWMLHPATLLFSAISFPRTSKIFSSTFAYGPVTAAAFYSTPTRTRKSRFLQPMSAASASFENNNSFEQKKTITTNTKSQEGKQGRKAETDVNDDTIHTAADPLDNMVVAPNEPGEPDFGFYALPQRTASGTYSPQFLEDNGLRLVTGPDGRVIALPIDWNTNDKYDHIIFSDENKRREKKQQQQQQQQNNPNQQKIVNNNKKTGTNSINKKKLGLSIKEELKKGAQQQQSRQQSATATSKNNNSSKQQLANNMSANQDVQPPIPDVILTPPKATKKSMFHRDFDKNNKKAVVPITESPATVVPTTGFNVILTHCTADFDSLASAVGLAKLWSAEQEKQQKEQQVDGMLSLAAAADKKTFHSASHVPTFVVLPRGAHPGVQRFLALHKHLFPIRSFKSLPANNLSALNRLALVDAQRRERLGPADVLLQHAKRVTVVDHHMDQDSDIAANDYVLDKVGSVTTIIVELLMEAVENGSVDALTEAEATLFALGIHADTGSLCFDSTTPRDAYALAWCLEQGASQAAIAEHAQSSLSQEQQGVLTQALMNANTTLVHGVTLSTVLLSAEGFINGLAAVTQDALELSSSDIFLLALVYEAQSGGKRRRGRKEGNGSGISNNSDNHSGNTHPQALLTSRLFSKEKAKIESTSADWAETYAMAYSEAWQGGEIALKRKRLRAAFDRKDIDGSGYLEEKEVAVALASSGTILTQSTVKDIMRQIDKDGDGRIDFEEFVAFANDAEKRQQEERSNDSGKSSSSTMIIIGRVKAGVNLKAVKLNKLFEPYGGGGHPKAASATIRLTDQAEAADVLQGLVDELISTSLQEQSTVGDFMTAPVLSVQPHMTEKQVEHLFSRYNVRALPVVDENNEVIGLVTYKEVAAAKLRLWNKEQKRIRQEREAAERGETLPEGDEKVRNERKQGSTVKGWMLQHVQMVEASRTMAEVESILLENDIGCMPVVADGTKKLVGMVTRTDLLRQHRYYPSLHYHNKGFADSIAARKPIIELRKKLKKFDLEE